MTTLLIAGLLAIAAALIVAGWRGAGVESAGASLPIVSISWLCWLWPGLPPNIRRVAPIVAVTIGGSTAMMVGRSGAPLWIVAGVAGIAGLLGPRVLFSLVSRQYDDSAEARTIVEFGETAAASGFTLLAAMEALSAEEGPVATIAADIAAAMKHSISDSSALLDQARLSGPSVNRVLRRLSMYVARGHWGPEAGGSLRQIRETIEKQRQLGEMIRVMTSDIRSLRLAIIVLLPAMVLLLFSQNHRVMVAYVRTPTGTAAMVFTALLYLTAVVITRWLIPDWEGR